MNFAIVPSKLMFRIPLRYPAQGAIRPPAGRTSSQQCVVKKRLEITEGLLPPLPHLGAGEKS